MRLISMALICLVLLLAVPPADARLHRAWGYADLTKTADLVVIARAVKTTDLGTQAALPDISSVDAAGKSTPVMGVEQETEFAVTSVLKGKAKKTIVLRHYREASTAPSLNGPGLVSFDPKENKQFLLFLLKEKDGRYAPVSGQTDPYQSVEELRQRAP